MLIVLSVGETSQRLSVEPTMLLLRQFSANMAPLSASLEPDRQAPVLNQRSTLLALMISFMVMSPSYSRHVPVRGNRINSLQVFSWICSLLRLYT